MTGLSASLFGTSWKEFGPGAREKRVEVNGRAVRLLELSPEFVEADFCRRAHEGLVLEGSLSVRLESGEVLKLAMGDALVLTTGDAHKAEVTAGEQALLLLFEEPRG